MTRKKSTSGTQWSEAEYRAAGYSRLTLRLSSEVKDDLRELADMSGWSIAELVTHLAAAEKKRRKSRASRAGEK